MTDEFDFDEDDIVIVRVRKYGTSGPIRAKLVGAVIEFIDHPGLLSDRVVIQSPWDKRLKFNSHEADFEVVDGVEECQF